MKVYANTMNRTLLGIQLVGLVWFMCFSLILAYLGSPTVATLVLLTVIALAILYLWQDNIQYPTNVGIDSNGILLEFRIGKNRQIEWKQIADMCLRPEDESKYASYRTRGRSIPYWIQRSIAVEIAREYAVTMGKEMPRWNGKRSSRVSPKD